MSQKLYTKFDLQVQSFDSKSEYHREECLIWGSILFWNLSNLNFFCQCESISLKDDKKQTRLLMSADDKSTLVCLTFSGSTAQTNDSNTNIELGLQKLTYDDASLFNQGKNVIQKGIITLTLNFDRTKISPTYKDCCPQISISLIDERKHTRLHMCTVNKSILFYLNFT